MEQMKTRRGSVIVGLAVLLISGCAGSILSQNETPGARFDRVMKEFAEHCAKTKLKPNDTACDILKLKPADPLGTEEGRFAHAIKIPNPVPEDSGYSPGMTPEEYFEHLCKTEAGEFIYKTVDNVDGLYMMRPREQASDYELEHLYALEDPYGHENAEAKRAEYMFVEPNRYSYVERLKQKDASHDIKDKNFAEPMQFSKYDRFVGYDARDLKSMRKESVDTLKSRYGFTWRGIARPHDRELGIAGGELIVLDLERNDVLGVRRGYIRSGSIRNNVTGIWWLNGQTCPTYGYRNGRNKDFDFSFWFIGKVLKPSNYAQSLKDLTHGK